MVRPLSPKFDLQLSRGVAAESASAFELPESGARKLAELWSGPRETDDPAFNAFLQDVAAAARGGEVSVRFPPYEEPAVTAPGAWNLTGDKLFAHEYPVSWNYLTPESPNYALKRFQRALYLRRLEASLETLPVGAHVLDLGGGIGRFAQEWATRGYTVTLADPNEQALTLALGHLAATQGRFALRHLAAESLTGLEDETFHAVSAMEVFCYLSEPSDGIAESARVLRPGGLLMASVESPVGSLDPTVPHTRDEIDATLSLTERAVEGDTWVRYFTPTSLRAAVESAGLEVLSVVGTHYLPDGPMHRLVDFERLGDPGYDAALLELEEVLEGTTRWRDTARAWLVVARKPG